MEATIVNYPVGASLAPVDVWVDTTGLVAATIGDVLAFDVLSGNLNDSDGASIHSRVIQATLVGNPTIVALSHCCVALETYAASSRTRLRARIRGITITKVHDLDVVAAPARGDPLYMNSGGGVPGRALVWDVGNPIVYRHYAGILLETHDAGNLLSENLPVFFRNPWYF